VAHIQQVAPIPELHGEWLKEGTRVQRLDIHGLLDADCGGGDRGHDSNGYGNNVTGRAFENAHYRAAAIAPLIRYSPARSP